MAGAMSDCQQDDHSDTKPFVRDASTALLCNGPARAYLLDVAPQVSDLDLHMDTRAQTQLRRCMTSLTTTSKHNADRRRGRIVFGKSVSAASNGSTRSDAHLEPGLHLPEFSNQHGAVILHGSTRTKPQQRKRVAEYNRHHLRRVCVTHLCTRPDQV